MKNINKYRTPQEKRMVWYRWRVLHCGGLPYYLKHSTTLNNLINEAKEYKNGNQSKKTHRLERRA
jgi:hypothetical protein